MTHEGPRGRRRSTILGVCIVLGVVALVLAITARTTGEPMVLVAAIVVAAVAMVLSTQARKASTTPPPKASEKMP
jgi:NhaP-type Na+/H+ or K+/H+ antiporter